MIDEIPTRAYDVGIAEQHAVTLAAGLATQGMTVYCTIVHFYNVHTILFDMALQNIQLFCIDRAGLVGEMTTHGVLTLLS